MSRPVLTLEGGVVSVERRTSKRGTPWLKVRVACEREERDQQSGRMKRGESMFITVNVWSDQAKNLADSVRPGDHIVVVGELDQKAWDTDDGVHHTDYEVLANVTGVSTRFTTAPTQRMRDNPPDFDPTASQVGTPDESEPPF